MKPLLLTALLAVLLLSSCSKKSTPAPATKTGSVTIIANNYPTIIIGSQTWTSFNYQGAGGSLTIADVTYGNYYTLAQAMLITLPTGWRIPTRADYNTLLSNYTTTKNAAGDFVGDQNAARALSDSTKWLFLGATSASGFSAFPGGEYDVTNKLVVNTQINAIFLTSTTGTIVSGGQTSTYNYFFAITDDGVGVGQSNMPYFAGIDYNLNPYAYSLRFVKDN